MEQINVKNFSFEDPTLPDGSATRGYSFNQPVPGWDIYDPKGLITPPPPNPPANYDYSDAGVYNVPNRLNPQPTNGQNISYAYVNKPPGSGTLGLQQDLGVPFTPNTRYTVSVDVTNPVFNQSDSNQFAGYTGFPGFGIEILGGSELWDYKYNPTQVADGEVKTVTFSITTPNADQLQNMGFAGKNLGIRLVNRNEAPGLEVGFDNVRITSEPVKNASYPSIQNFGFEEPVLQEDGSINNTTNPNNPIPGWQIYDPDQILAKFIQPFPSNGDFAAIGVYNPAEPANYPNGTTEGKNMGFIYLPNYAGSPIQPGAGKAGMSQTLGTITPNTRYSLVVDVGNPASYVSSTEDFNYDLNGFPGYRIELLAGNQVIAADNNSLKIAEGSWGSTNIDVVIPAFSPFVGQQLTARLINLNEAPGSEVDFDFVGLVAEDIDPLTGINSNQIGTLFDPDFYLASNLDVANEVKQGKMTPIDHFINFGQFEGRDPSQSFNTRYYLSVYPDVNNAFSLGRLTPIQHFIEFGQAEGRVGAIARNPL